MKVGKIWKKLHRFLMFCLLYLVAVLLVRGSEAWRLLTMAMGYEQNAAEAFDSYLLSDHMPVGDKAPSLARI